MENEAIKKVNEAVDEKAKGVDGEISDDELDSVTGGARKEIQKVTPKS